MVVLALLVLLDGARHVDDPEGTQVQMRVESGCQQLDHWEHTGNDWVSSRAKGG